jgi:hypothetical protein
MPENSEFEPLRVDLKQEPLLIEGIVVGVLRRGGGGAAAKSTASRVPAMRSAPKASPGA